MVKGISRQVIVVHSPDPKLFEQAIFILREDAIGMEGVTDEALLKEANRLVRGNAHTDKMRKVMSGPIWACAGALLTAFIWLITTVL